MSLLRNVEYDLRRFRAAEAGELPPRIAAHADFFLCRFCPYAARCWEANP